MNEEQTELTSALLDGELDAASQERVVTSLLGGDPEGRACYARYRLIGADARAQLEPEFVCGGAVALLLVAFDLACRQAEIHGQ